MARDCHFTWVRVLEIWRRLPCFVKYNRVLTAFGILEIRSLKTERAVSLQQTQRSQMWNFLPTGRPSRGSWTIVPQNHTQTQQNNSEKKKKKPCDIFCTCIRVLGSCATHFVKLGVIHCNLSFYCFSAHDVLKLFYSLSSYAVSWEVCVYRVNCEQV